MRRAMAAPGSPPERRRPRRGSVVRPVNGRLYRASWLLVVLPLLAAAIAVTRPTALPTPELPPAFDAATAGANARELARVYPDRSPGTAGSREAAQWVADRFRAIGLRPQVQAFEADVPGRGRVVLRNVIAITQGRSSDAIVVLAHRDDSGAGAGANDNASGTATLLELARTYASATDTARVTTTHTIVFVSTDAAVTGGLG